MKNIFQHTQLALTLVRITLGIIFIIHGGQKVLGVFGGPGLTAFVSWAGTYHIPSAVAYLAAFSEFIGGILLLTGVAAELGALMTIGVMLGAVLIIHRGHGFFAQNGGFEYPLSLILFALAIIIGGPGLFALWDPLKTYKEHCCERK